jgi:hypothetical protein
MAQSSGLSLGYDPTCRDERFMDRKCRDPYRTSPAYAARSSAYGWAAAPACVKNGRGHAAVATIPQTNWDDRRVPDRYYELPLPDEYLVLLGRQARAAGAVELIARWLVRVLLTPQDFTQSADRVRRLQYAQVAQMARDVAPIRADAMKPVTRFHFVNNLTSWLNAADGVMQKRNAYLHGYWLAPDQDSPLPGYWDRQERRTSVTWRRSVLR